MKNRPRSVGMILLGISLILGTLMGAYSALAAGPEFVEFCHVPQGNPQNKVMIRTAEQAAINGHFRETSSLDQIGECSEVTPVVTEEAVTPPPESTPTPTPMPDDTGVDPGDGSGDEETPPPADAP